MSDPQAPRLAHDVDVTIVGSGSGGSVSALRLVEKGCRGIVLRAGACGSLTWWLARREDARMPSEAQRSIIVTLDADVVADYEAAGDDLSEVVNALPRMLPATHRRAESTAQERHAALSDYLDRVLLEDGPANEPGFEAEVQHFVGLLTAADDGSVR